jgi:ATP-dependent DNA ligase
VKSGDDVRLLSRRNKDLTRDFPSVVAAVQGVGATTATLDGEIVAVDENGVPRF